ncbi:hypothetical protein F2P56_027178 [Juglans regia]|uniref:Reverse transcriptase domain-containing protein n=1 Tax=Juglans regia TaxID=51240 RepID=A0A833U879_JUGRE|nr:hypothetical protein F2P56_027178 [Juglans regia]
MEVEILNYSQRHISAWITSEGGKKERWLLTGFYGNPETSMREESWQLLGSLKPIASSGWCVVGDFNEILTQDEKWGGRARPEKQMSRFRKVLEDGGLYDLGWRGDKFTWSNKHEDETFTKERLDRVVANLVWKDIFKEGWVEVLVDRSSDHRPILLTMNQLENQEWKKQRVFRYEAKWALEEECEEVIKKVWQRDNIKRLNGLLEDSKGALMSWSKHLDKEKGRSLREKSERLKQLQGMEGIHNIEEIKGLQREIGEMLEIEDLKWKQRAKLNWYQLGDRNTKFFHNCANQRRRKNAIKVIHDEQNRRLSSPSEMEGVFNRYFQKLFTSSEPSKDEITNCLKNVEPRVSNEMNVNLTRSFTRLEVEDAINQMAPLKSPGPDGFKKVLEHLVSPNQSAFIPGRLITDNIMVAYEVLHTMKARQHGREGSMAIKLDMSKAYDRIEWSYLEEVMFKLGLCKMWIDLVMSCVKTVSYSVLINGRPGKRIFPQRGLRQGDPLSPYLFILCAEGLSSLLNSSDSKGETRGVTVARGGTRVNHLLFADDCLLFGRAKEEEWVRYQKLLMIYERASGQFQNKDKIAVFFSSNTREEVKGRIKELGGDVIRGSYEKYLGLPPLVGKSKYNTFMSIKERVWKKINNWKNIFLSASGKEILVKAVLQALSTYAMSVFKLPKRLCNELNMMLAKFWWGNSQKTNCVHWCSWEKMGDQKDRGGLGFRDLIVLIWLY